MFHEEIIYQSDGPATGFNDPGPAQVRALDMAWIG
jgi:hypothetical protein